MLDTTARKYLRAAEQRYTAAEVLFHEGRNLESMYLAGYVVECATKALILARTSPKDRSNVMLEAFRGRRGHDYEELKAMLRQRQCTIPLPIAVLFRRISSWSTDLRYEVGFVPTKDAEQFLAAAKDIMDWVKRSL